MHVLFSSLLTEENSKEQIIEKLCNSEDIQFNWLIVSADFDKEDQNVQRRKEGVRSFRTNLLLN